LNLNPKADDFYTDRGGGAYLRKDHYDHAIKDYDEALKINPKNGEGYLARGQVKESSRNYRGALAGIMHGRLADVA
jgi:tetratricopeptide (TPR) repeat protein